MCKCEKCGDLLRVEIKEFTESLICPSCGWGIATTHMPEILSDETTYIMRLLLDSDNNLNKLKIISKIINKNYVQTKKMIQTSVPIVIKGKAIFIYKIKTILDEHLISYKITPYFKYFRYF